MTAAIWNIQKAHGSSRLAWTEERIAASAQTDAHGALVPPPARIVVCPQLYPRALAPTGARDECRQCGLFRHGHGCAARDFRPGGCESTAWKPVIPAPHYPRNPNRESTANSASSRASATDFSQYTPRKFQTRRLKESVTLGRFGKTIPCNGNSF